MLPFLTVPSAGQQSSCETCIYSTPFNVTGGCLIKIREECTGLSLALMKLIREVQKWLLPHHTFLLALNAHRARAVFVPLLRRQGQRWWRCCWGQETGNLKLTCWKASCFIWKIPLLLCMTPSKSFVLLETDRLLFALMFTKPVLQFHSQNCVRFYVHSKCSDSV